MHVHFFPLTIKHTRNHISIIACLVVTRQKRLVRHKPIKYATKLTRPTEKWKFFKFPINLCRLVVKIVIKKTADDNFLFLLHQFKLPRCIVKCSCAYTLIHEPDIYVCCFAMFTIKILLLFMNWTTNLKENSTSCRRSNHTRTEAQYFFPTNQIAPHSYSENQSRIGRVTERIRFFVIEYARGTYTRRERFSYYNFVFKLFFLVILLTYGRVLF